MTMITRHITFRGSFGLYLAGHVCPVMQKDNPPEWTTQISMITWALVIRLNCVIRVSN